MWAKFRGEIARQHRRRVEQLVNSETNSRFCVLTGCFLEAPQKHSVLSTQLLQDPLPWPTALAAASHPPLPAPCTPAMCLFLFVDVAVTWPNVFGCLSTGYT